MGCGASSKGSSPQPWVGSDDSTQSLQAVEEVVRPQRNSAVENDLIPEYWYNKKTKDQGIFDDMYYVQDNEHHKFDSLFAASYVGRVTQDRPCPSSAHDRTPGGCPCVQPGGDPGMPVGYRVQRVIRVESSSMWAKYQAKFENIKAKRRGTAEGRFHPELITEGTARKYKGLFSPLDTEMNEVYSFHGTFVRAALSIAQNDFNIDLAGTSRGTLYGRGAYLAESISKADEYAKDEPGGYYDGVFSVLVCRVCMGKLYNTSDDPSAADKIKKGEFDSTCGQRLFRELVIYDADQLYPEYVVLYKRIYQRDSEAYIASLLKQRFFMEVPLHWRNNDKSLKEGFREQTRGLPGMTEFLQTLVNMSLGRSSHNVEQSSQVENAELWLRYGEFKTQLRERLGGHEGSRAGEGSSLDAVEKDLKDLTKFPCKFGVKGSCKFGDKCRFSHNPATASLSASALSAGRRLPLDELDQQLNERFLWFAGDKRQSVSLSKGSFKTEDASEAFFQSLPDALGRVQSEEGKKYAMLCRVVCGTPGDAPSSPKHHGSSPYRVSSDCSVATSGSAQATVTIWNSFQVYPEYMVELHSSEDARREGLSDEEVAELRNQAAMKIQCLVRCCTARKRVKALRHKKNAREQAERQEVGRRKREEAAAAYNAERRIREAQKEAEVSAELPADEQPPAVKTQSTESFDCDMLLPGLDSDRDPSQHL